MRKKHSGFTLVELLVSISILAILSTVGLVVFRSATSQVKDSQRIKDLQAIKQALELYRSDIHNYPTTTNFNLASTVSLTNCNGISPCTVSTTYLSQIPKDSNSSNYYFYLALTEGNSACDNSSASTACLQFILCAKRESSDNSRDLDACATLDCGTAVKCDIGISSD